MFSILGIIALIFVIYIRPQEVYADLQALPLLYGCLGLAVFGVALDIRLRINRPRLSPQVLWVVCFAGWSILTVLFNNPGVLLSTVRGLLILLTFYFVISHGVQTFRGLGMLAGAVAALGTFLAFVGTEQHFSPTGCIEIAAGSETELSVGRFDGRGCDEAAQCLQDGEPGAEYLCEHVGLLQTHSVGGGRVRYRGVLEDPNELAIMISVALAFLIALLEQRKRRFVLYAVAGALMFLCVVFTQSRSGQLAFLLVGGAYFVRKVGWKSILLMAPVVLMVALFSQTGERRDASSSTNERLEAWATGLELFRSDPLFGVGQGLFTDHHYLTAHNFVVQVAAEQGIIGLFFVMMILYVSLKIPWEGMRLYRDRKEASVAYIWSVALFAGMLGVLAGGMFLSLGYHYVLWMEIAMAGALWSAITSHDPEFRIKISPLEGAFVMGASLGGLGILFGYLRLKGFL